MSGFEFMNILMAKDLAEREEREREKESLFFDEVYEEDEDDDMWDWTKKSW